jgi:DNA polymerase-4
MQRTIFHLDLDAFYCAVEELHNPSLRGKAFAVGGSPTKRGVVASCSYPARMFGIRSAMPMSRAVQLCPNLIIVRHNHGEYGAMSKRVMAILNDTTPFVEKLSIDEAFLDMTGFSGEPYALAAALQQRINEELELPCSLGVAANKLVAKIANNMGKARKKTGQPPNAIEVVPPGTEADYLAPLPIRELWGVGPKTAERMHELGIQSIGDIAARDERFLIDQFGKVGYDLHLRARGIDARPVITERATKSVSSEITFDVDVNDSDDLKRTLRQQSDNVGRRLRKAGLSGRTVQIKVRWEDFTTITRQTTCDQPSHDDHWIYETALALFHQVWDGRRRIRLIGVGVSGFESAARQLSLWETDESKQQRDVQNTLDDIRERFGDDALQRGSDL